MITVETKNGVTLYINVCDIFPGGGYLCEVYLNKDDEFEYDTFFIHNEELSCVDIDSREEFIQICCENYANNLDDMPILNKRFNKVYNSISDAYSLLSDFYTNHIHFKNGNTSVRDNIKELFEKLGDIKEIAHEVAEHYTWDK